MNEEQEKHAKIALWLGYWQNADNLSVWYIPNARGYKERQGFSGPPDFYSGPAHYERIKAKLRELDISYNINYHSHEDRSIQYYLGCYEDSSENLIGDFVGPSEGDVLVQSALALIERGIE